MGDLFKGEGESASGQPDAPPPDGGWSPSTEAGPVDGMSGDTAAGEPVRLFYDGHAVADSRQARIALAIAPDGTATAPSPSRASASPIYGLAAPT